MAKTFILKRKSIWLFDFRSNLNIVI